MVVLEVLILANGQIIAQESYGSRRIISPGHPLGTGPIVDSYSEGSAFNSRVISDSFGDPYAGPYIGGRALPAGHSAIPIGGGVLPVGGGVLPVGGGVLPVGGTVYPTGGVIGGVIGGRRPSIIEDRSSSRVESINVSNNNNNHRVQLGSNNVVVNQFSTSGRRCSCQVGILDQCYPQVCIPDSTCIGGGGICGSGHSMVF